MGPTKWWFWGTPGLLRPNPQDLVQQSARMGPGAMAAVEGCALVLGSLLMYPPLPIGFCNAPGRVVGALMRKQEGRQWKCTSGKGMVESLPGFTKMLAATE